MVSTKTQSQRLYSIILFRTCEILHILENLLLILLRTQLQLHFQRSLCNTLTWDVLFLWCLAELKQRLLVEWRKTWPFDRCCSHQSVASPSLCLCHGSRWTFWAHFVMLSARFQSVNAENIFEFVVLLFCLSPTRNMSETLYQVWARRR